MSRERDNSATPMDLPSDSRLIGAREYRVSRLTLGHWIRLETLIIRVLGLQVLDIDERNIGQYAPKMLAGAKASDHEELFELIGLCLAFRGDGSENWHLLTRPKQERHWAHHMSELAGVIALFFEVQFADFFRGLDTVLPKVDEQGEPSEDPKDQAGAGLPDVRPPG